MAHHYGLDVGAGAACWIERDNRRGKTKKEEAEKTPSAEGKGKMFKLITSRLFFYYKYVQERNERISARGKLIG
jgi:hypothetical protein